MTEGRPSSRRYVVSWFLSVFPTCTVRAVQHHVQLHQICADWAAFAGPLTLIANGYCDCVQEKRKRDVGQAKSAKNYVEEEKRLARNFGMYSGFDT